jgi:hypothetical protein
VLLNVGLNHLNRGKSTFCRVLQQIDAAHFEPIAGARLLAQEISVLAPLAVQGKVLRGSGRGDGKPPQLLSAVSRSNPAIEKS